MWKESLFMTYRGYTAHFSKLFTTFVPICDHFRLYMCYLGELAKNKTHTFQCFSAPNEVIIRVYRKLQLRCIFKELVLKEEEEEVERAGV